MKNLSELRKMDWLSRRQKTIEEYIKGKITINNETGCWEAKNTQPPKYCYCQYNYESFVLHRKAYEVFVGEIPEGQIVRHKCDNSICCNPEHLEVGTKKDNRNDFMQRHPKAVELIQDLKKNAGNGVSRFWMSLSKEEKEEFVKNRAQKQKEKRLAKNLSF